jgi:hypothetical protein
VGGTQGEVPTCDLEPRGLGALGILLEHPAQSGLLLARCVLTHCAQSKNTLIGPMIASECSLPRYAPCTPSLGSGGESVTARDDRLHVELTGNLLSKSCV